MSSVDTRHLERDSMFLMADLVIAGGGPALRVKVRNLSSGGMMVTSDARVRRGQRVAVELRNIGAVAGTVVWKRPGKFGVAFEEEIDPKQARSKVAGEPREAPGYARPAVTPPRYDGWNGKLRRI